MSLTKVKVDQKSERLMMALNDAIAAFTTHTPMTLQDIIGVLAFTTGGAIGRATPRNLRRQLRQMADANMDYGTEATSQQTTSSLILPEHFHQ